MMTLKIKKSDLLEAFEMGSVEVTFYLDSQTGRVVVVDDESRFSIHEYSDSSDDLDTLKAAIRADDMLPDWQRDPLLITAEVLYGDPDRYIEIPSVTSREGYDDMEAYIETLEAGHLRDLLEVAINGKGAFRRFKDVLYDYPDAREAWFTFQAQRLHDRMMEWLADHDIEPDFE